LTQLAGLSRIDTNEQEAAESGQWKPLQDLPALVQRAIDAGASVDKPDLSERTALGNAIASNNVDVAQAGRLQISVPRVSIPSRMTTMAQAGVAPAPVKPP
jgi:hypothetical protein